MTLRLGRDWPLCHQVWRGFIEGGDVALAVQQGAPSGVTTPRGAAD